METIITLRVREKEKGNWMWELELPPIDGKRNRTTKSGYKTKKEATLAGNAEKKKFEENINASKMSKLTFSNLLDIWYEDYCLIQLKESSYIGYKKKFPRIKEKLGNKKVTAITTYDVQKFINEMVKEEFSMNSIGVYKGIITGSLNFAITILQIITLNPAKAARLPKKRSELAKKTRKHPHTYIKDDEVKKIIERFPEGSSAHIPIILCLRAGLRKGEAFGVAWEDIDFDAGTLDIKRQMQYSEKRKVWYISDTKYDSNRRIGLDNKTLALLKRAKETQQSNKTKFGDMFVEYYLDKDGIINLTEGKKIEFVNVRDNGELITTNICEYTSEVIRNELGIKNFTMHSLRHTNATKLIENGVSAKAVQVRLGHKNIEETMNIYTHCSCKMEDNAVEIANAIF